jgi:hypothetical protein
MSAQVEVDPDDKFEMAALRLHAICDVLQNIGSREALHKNTLPALGDMGEGLIDELREAHAACVGEN